MTVTKALIAGFTGGPGQNHQGDMWVPALASAGLEAVDVWLPPTSGEQALRHAREVADRLGLDLQVSEQPDTVADCAIVCLVGEERRAFLTYAAERGMPVLLDKPTLDTTEQLESVARIAGPIAVPHHFSHHPGYTRGLAAIRSGEIGLLRGVFADLVVAHGDGAHPDGELRNLGVYPIDLIRQATGPARVKLRAHEHGGGWSLLGQTERDVVVSTHVSRTAADGGGSGTLRAHVRLLGTHGTVVIDLMRPALDIRRPGECRSVPFGENSVAAVLRQFATAVQRGGPFGTAADTVVLSKALDGIAASAASRRHTTITW